MDRHRLSRTDIEVVAMLVVLVVIAPSVATEVPKSARTGPCLPVSEASAAGPRGVGNDLTDGRIGTRLNARLSAGVTIRDCVNRESRGGRGPDIPPRPAG